MTMRTIQEINQALIAAISAENLSSVGQAVDALRIQHKQSYADIFTTVKRALPWFRASTWDDLLYRVDNEEGESCEACHLGRAT